MKTKFVFLVALLLLMVGCPNGQGVEITFSAGENGTLTASVDGKAIASGEKVVKNKEVVFTATPNEGYEVANWTGATADAGNITTAKLKVAGAVTISVQFKRASLAFKVGEIPFKMIKILAVTGAEIGHDAQNYNKVYKVSLSTYYIGETEVTQELYAIVLTGDNEANAIPSHYKDSPADGETQAKRPVEQVSWFDAIYFCNALTKKIMTETDCVYTITNITRDFISKRITDATVTADWTKKGFRLPTSAEWEYAAMGGRAEKWAGTNDETNLVNFAWFKTNSDNKTHEVAKKTANGYNIYDMSGNVYEWCWDWFESLDSTDLGQDPTGPDSNFDRKICGGNFESDASKLARAYFYSLNPVAIWEDLSGIRLVCRP